MIIYKLKTKVSRLWHCAVMLLIALNLGYAQKVEITGKLKLDVSQTPVYNQASFALVMDDSSQVAKKDLSLLGIPSSSIVMSESENNSLLIQGGFVKKGRLILPVELDSAAYGPGVFDTINTIDAPAASQGVWTGTELIVWNSDTQTGGRYNPVGNFWAPISNTGAPSSRSGATVIWTGTEMIVWGGTVNLATGLNTGGRYDPVLDTWTSMSITNAPVGRFLHTTIWTGTEMIVWGGSTSFVTQQIQLTNTGGRYNPVTDTWTSTSQSNAPQPTCYHSAVWTGTMMIVHGGIGNGAYKLYNPIANSWTNMPNVTDPRHSHTAIWSGSKMIVWGGVTSNTNPAAGSNTGKMFDPVSGTWSVCSTVNAPSMRYGHSSVFTGTEMIVWGGVSDEVYNNTGARFNPSNNSWIQTSMSMAPTPRAGHLAAWTGNVMCIYGGSDDAGYTAGGGRYNPVTAGYFPVSNLTLYLYQKN